MSKKDLTAFFRAAARQDWAQGVDNEGHQVQLDPQDGWQHLDGSVSHDDATTITDHHVHVVGARDDTPPEIHRGVSVVLPPHIHKIVHDSSQPMPARAHLLLSEVRKQHTGIDAEDVRGGTGGLGEMWSPDKDTAHQFGRNGGFGAYRDHEREHGCGDPETGDGGCPTTTVVMHAKTPTAEHHWNDMMRPGEEFGSHSWRLPVRPGAPIDVHGISWHQGEDHLSHGDQQTMNRARGTDGEGTYKAPPSEHYDFSAPVEKHSSLVAAFRQAVRVGDALGEKIIAQAAAEVEDGIMIALVPPHDVADQLAVHGTEPADQLHVTLAYLGKTSQYTQEELAWLPELVGSWARRHEPLTVRIGGVGKFSSPDQHVLWASADIPGGSHVHSDLEKFLTGHGYRMPSEHGWNPHMTLSYVDKHFRFLPQVPEVSWTADRVFVCVAGRWTPVLLGGASGI